MWAGPMCTESMGAALMGVELIGVGSMCADAVCAASMRAGSTGSASLRGDGSVAVGSPGACSRCCWASARLIPRWKAAISPGSWPAGYSGSCRGAGPPRSWGAMCSWARRLGSWGLPMVPRTVPVRGVGGAVTCSTTSRRSSGLIPGTASAGSAAPHGPRAPAAAQAAPSALHRRSARFQHHRASARPRHGPKTHSRRTMPRPHAERSHHHPAPPSHR